ncbi:MAG: HAMP domain-containing histidine kinase [Ignavibacteriales bacterium]|nr:MAG: HAMP domain-containing histidine kinase [Ignavibacteriales bacterium]
MEIVIILIAFALLMVVINYIHTKIKTTNEPLVDDTLLKSISKDRQNEIIKLKERIEKLQSSISRLNIRANELETINADLEKAKKILEEKLDNIEELHKRKEELFAMYIHDVKNPASAIKSFVNLLETYDLSLQEQREIMSTILTAADRIIRLSTVISRSIFHESNGFAAEFKFSSLSSAVNHCIKNNMAKAKLKKQEIILSIDHNIPEIWMDMDKIIEAIDNLIDNAIKYSPEDSQIEITAKKENNFVLVEVSDEGPGLTSEDVKRAFQKGARLSAKPTGDEVSTGLGLWVVKMIIETHGGYTWVKSEVGHGSRFGFKIPINKSVHSNN